MKLTFFVNFFSDVPLIDDGPRKKRAAANRIDFKAILQEDDDEISDKKFEKYLETIQQMESQRANSMTSAYNPKVITVSRILIFCEFFVKSLPYFFFQADIKIGYKNRMMDLRKITNHPYLIKYPLTEDGIFYKIDEGKFITNSRNFFNY